MLCCCGLPSLGVCEGELNVLSLKSMSTVFQAHDNLHPNAPRGAALQRLEQCLVDMARRYRDPVVPPFDPEPLVVAYNGLLNNPAHHYVIGRYECAMEFLSAPGMRGGGLLNNIEFVAGFLTSFDQLGFCPWCQVQQQLVRYF